MKKFYTHAYNFFIILKVLCPVISFFYALLWFISFFEAPFYDIVKIPFEPFANFVNSIYPLNIEFQGRMIDMSYIVSSGLFIVFHYIFDFFAQRVIDLYNFDEMKKIKKKDKEIKNLNVILKKEFEEEIEKYVRFALLFNLELKPAYNLSVSRKGEFDLLKKEFYSYIVKNVSSKYKNSKGIMSDKLFLVCENFYYFDDFMLQFIEEIKTFNEINIKKDITTEFSISTDAIKLGSNVFNAMEFLEKVDSFNYKNKIVATSAFKLRYEKIYNPRFRMIPLGISRFFREPDDYIDFELYNLKPRKYY